MTEDLLNRGIAALKAGRKAEARGLLAQLVEQEPRHELGWLWLSGAVDTDEDRRVCLENVLAINPNNDLAQRGLETLQRSSPPGPAGATYAGRPRPAEGDDGGADEEIARLLQKAVAAIKSGDKERGKQLLIEVIEREEDNEAAWLWMCRCVTDRDVKRECFERVLAINPDNKNAVEGLKRLDVLAKADAPSSKHKNVKLSTRQTSLMLGFGSAALALVCIGIIGVWWAINSGLLPSGSASPVTANAMPTPSSADTTLMPSPTTSTQPPTLTLLPTQVPRYADDYVLRIEDMPSYYEIVPSNPVVSLDGLDGYSTQFQNTLFEDMDFDQVADFITGRVNDPISNVCSMVFVFETRGEAEGQVSKMVRAYARNWADMAKSNLGWVSSVHQSSVANFADEVSVQEIAISMETGISELPKMSMTKYVYGFRRDNVIVILTVTGWVPWMGSADEECGFYAGTILAKIDRDAR